MRTTAEKTEAFRTLHARPGAFIIPNPWDVGSARLLARLGFEALATSSAGAAFAAGQRDNSIGRERMLAHAQALVDATDLPVSADLENGFGDDPDTVAETIRRAAALGLAGGSIEDATARADEPIYPFDLAVERVRAAAAVARAQSHPFTLTARAENFLVGRRDLADTIRRLQAYQDAGADVLYAPAVTRRDDIATLVAAVDRPVNVLAGVAGLELDLAGLAQVGVKRVSVGSALARAAFGALLRAADEMRTRGSFTFAGDAVSYADLSEMFES